MHGVLLDPVREPVHVRDGEAVRRRAEGAVHHHRRAEVLHPVRDDIGETVPDRFHSEVRLRHREAMQKGKKIS